MPFILPRTVSRTPSNTIQTIVEGVVRGRYHWMFRPYDTMIVDHYDATNHLVYLKRTGDIAANNGYGYKLISSGYTPAPGDEVVVAASPNGPFVQGKLL